MISKFQARLLEINSLPQLEEIILSRRCMGVHPISLEDARETYVKISTLVEFPDGKNFVWGSFDGDLLSAVLVQTFATPCEHDWLMSYLTVNPKSRYPWNYSKNGLDEAWETAISLAEEKGRTIIRWSLPLEWAQTQDKTKKTSRIWKNYTIHTYAIVKAGETPINKLDQWIAGKVKPYDVALKKAFKSDLPDVSVI